MHYFQAQIDAAIDRGNNPDMSLYFYIIKDMEKNFMRVEKCVGIEGTKDVCSKYEYLDSLSNGNVPRFIGTLEIPDDTFLFSDRFKPLDGMN